jgi:hypothetical protein
MRAVFWQISLDHMKDRIPVESGLGLRRPTVRRTKSWISTLGYDDPKVHTFPIGFREGKGLAASSRHQSVGFESKRMWCGFRSTWWFRTACHTLTYPFLVYLLKEQACLTVRNAIWHSGVRQSPTRGLDVNFFRDIVRALKRP